MKNSRTKTTSKSKTATAGIAKPKRQQRSSSSSSRSSLPPLMQREIGFRKFVEFPGIKGRVVEKVELFTMADYHSLTVYFQDGPAWPSSSIRACSSPRASLISAAATSGW